MLSAHLWVSGVSRAPRPSSVPTSKCSLSCGKGMANLGTALVSQLPRASWGSPPSAKELIASSNWLPCGPAALRSKVTSQGGHAPVTDPTGASCHRCATPPRWKVRQQTHHQTGKFGPGCPAANPASVDERRKVEVLVAESGQWGWMTGLGVACECVHLHHPLCADPCQVV